MSDGTTTTRDIGFAIRDFLENRLFDLWGGEDGDETIGADRVEEIDISDPNNPLIRTESGKEFRVRIFAGPC